MNEKPTITREERLARAEQDSLDRQAGMKDYLDQQQAIEANRLRLRDARLAKEAADALAAPAKKAPKKSAAAKRVAAPK